MRCPATLAAMTRSSKPGRPSRPRRLAHAGRGLGFSRSRESGYVLLGVLLLTALVTLSLSVAAMQIAKSIQRDREQEAVQRGKQYIRAIRLYYRKFGKYPASIDELEKTNNLRYLRRRYLDPLTGKDDWKLIHLGEAKVPTMGLFGQAMGIPGASPIAGASANQPTSITDPTGSQSSTTVGLQPGDPTGGNGPIANQPGLTQSTPAPSPTDPGSPSSGGLGGTSSGGFGSGASGGFGSGTSGGLGSGPGGQGGSLFGNAGGSTGTTGIVIGQIVGIGIPVDKKSLLNYKKQTNYNKWEFVYDPVTEQANIPNSGGLNQNGVNQPGSVPQKTSQSPDGNTQPTDPPGMIGPDPK